MNEERKYIVYKHTSPNGKSYIGCTCRELEVRSGSNGINYKEKQKKFYNDIVKFGWDNFSHEILYDNLSEEEAFHLEREMISKYQTTNPEMGYNVTIGGKGRPGVGHTEVAKQKIGQAHLGIKMDEQSKIKMSEAHTGVNLSDYHKKRISDALSNKQKSKEHIKSMSESRIGHKHTEETKEKISNNTPLNKSVVCVETGIIYKSMSEAARCVGGKFQNISISCKIPTRTCCGCHWMYYDDWVKSKSN